MNKLPALIMCLFASLLSLVPLLAEEFDVGDTIEIVFDQGSTIRGPVLRTDSQSLVIDLGFKVLVVERRRIASLKRIEEQAVAQEDDAAFYSRQRLPAQPVADLVARQADAVVLVSTPSGLGTGFFINDEGYLLTNFHVTEGETDIRITRFVQGANGFERQELKDVKIIAFSHCAISPYCASTMRVCKIPS